MPYFHAKCYVYRFEDLYQNFLGGLFTINKINQAFSSIGIDQEQEQNNTIIKTDYDTIGILDNPKSLLKRAVAGSIFGKLLNEILYDEENGTTQHHEDTDGFGKKRSEKT